MQIKKTHYDAIENMMKIDKKTFIYFVFGIIFFLASIWCLMWIFSSASLASEFCLNQFNLFHEDFRCKQPYIASIGFLLTGIGSLILFVFGIRRITRKADKLGE